MILDTTTSYQQILSWLSSLYLYRVYESNEGGIQISLYFLLRAVILGKYPSTQQGHEMKLTGSD